MAKRILMPQATAVWLIDNTSLTFRQIADFVNMQLMEVEAIADGDVAGNIKGFNPLLAGLLTRQELDRCAADPNATLTLVARDIPEPPARKGPRYTPLARRVDKPDAISWLLKRAPELSDAQIARLVGTTRTMIHSVRDRTYWNYRELRARSPVELGLCKAAELQKELDAAAPNRAAMKSTETETESAESPLAETPEQSFDGGTHDPDPHHSPDSREAGEEPSAPQNRPPGGNISQEDLERIFSSDVFNKNNATEA